MLTLLANEKTDSWYERVPLHRDLDLAVLGAGLEVDDVAVDGVLRLVHVGDEVLDAALVVELDRLAAFGALVGERDAQPLRQERRLAEAREQRRGVVHGLVEDLRVCEERDGRAGLARLADDLHRPLRHAARELLAIDLAVAADLGDEPFGERVHDRGADAVQAAGDLVAVAAELAAGMQLREHDLERRHALARDDVHRDARAAVDDRDRVVGVDRDADVVVPAGERLVDGVVDDLRDQVMEAADPGRADVHTGAETDRLEAFEHGDVLGRVSGLRLGVRHN